MRVEILLPTNVAPSGFGVIRVGLLVKLTTPCCEAVVGNVSGGFVCNRCSKDYNYLSDKTGYNLAYEFDLSDWNTSLQEVIEAWLRGVTEDPKLEIVVTK